MNNTIDKLKRTQDLSDEEFLSLLESDEPTIAEELRETADQVRRQIFGDSVYLRGLIEISSYCKNDCYYCGLRRGNRSAERYRLSQAEILAAAASAHKAGLRTIVLQGGEDPYFTTERLETIIGELRQNYPDTAITLSLGERDKEDYQRFYAAGANRYLLRHETATPKHYADLHPAELTLAHRQECLTNLKAIGYQVGCGFMVDSPGQRPEHLLADLRYLQELQPEMVGIGPFVPHHDTPFAKEKAGSLQKVLKILSLIRLILPAVLLPATTALGTIHPQGRELGILAGANVIMPNTSPPENREKYLLYDGKHDAGKGVGDTIATLSESMQKIGYKIDLARGDHRNIHP